MEELGRRERKKLETRRALRAAARELALDRSLADLTIEEITERADVSVRTFFNYFSSKEDAIVGVEPEELEALAALLLARPDREGPVDALLAVFDTDGDRLESWASRTAVGDELIRLHPSLKSRRLAVLVEVEHTLVAALGERLGIDAQRDVAPTAVVSAVIAVMRASLAWWHTAGEPGPYHRTLERAVAPVRAAYDVAPLVAGAQQGGRR